MATENGHSYQLIEAQLLKRATNYSFVQGYKLLCECVIAQKRDPIHLVRIRPVLGLSLPRSEIYQIIKHIQDDGTFIYFIDVNISGLYGNSSPLPKFFTEELIQAALKDQNQARIFLDILHQRLYQLLFQAKTYLQPYFEDSSKQTLHEFMFSMAGFRDQAWLRSFPDPAFVLRNINLFRYHKGTAAGIRLLIEKLFKNTKVTIEQCYEHWFHIPRNQRLGIGKQGHKLGENTLLGNKMNETLGKVIIHISVISAKEYKYWFNNEKNWSGLKSLLRYFIGQPLIIELKLEVENNPQFLFQLNHKNKFTLGRNTWLLAEHELKSEKPIRNINASLRLL